MFEIALWSPYCHSHSIMYSKWIVFAIVVASCCLQVRGLEQDVAIKGVLGSTVEEIRNVAICLQKAKESGIVLKQEFWVGLKMCPVGIAITLDELRYKVVEQINEIAAIYRKLNDDINRECRSRDWLCTFNKVKEAIGSSWGTVSALVAALKDLTIGVVMIPVELTRCVGESFLYVADGATVIVKDFRACVRHDSPRL